jgi:2-keto-4-pentenoate hydratase
MSFDVDRAAAALVDGRRKRRLVASFAPNPASVGDAYAVQNSAARSLGPIGGWKIGAKSPTDLPNAAPLLADLMRPSPAVWDSASLHMIGIEAEIAFRIARTIPSRSTPLSRNEAWASIGSVHAAIEIVDTRLSDWRDADRLWLLVDNQSNGGFVYDPNGVAWEEQDFSDAAVRLSVNGATIAAGRGGNTAGDPRWILHWLLDHCARHRGGVAAGALVTTGSYTGMAFVEAGATVEATVEGIGSVQVRFP